MDVLIDTQILIWIQEGNLDISKRAVSRLTDTTNIVYVSQISLFEIAIKLKIGKLPAFRITLEELIRQIDKDGFQLLQLKSDHLLAYDRIPLHADHRDPFDRLILATALAEKMPLISADGHFKRYTDLVDVIW